MSTRPLALARTPAESLACLAGEPGAFALSVPDPERPVTLVGCAPRAELRVEPSAADPLGDVVRFLEATPVLDAALPFPLAGGAVACLAYELGARIVPGLRAAAAPGPLAVLRRYDPVLVFDQRRRTWTLVGSTDAPPPWLERLADPVPAWHGPLATGELRAGFDRDA